MDGTLKLIKAITAVFLLFLSFQVGAVLKGGQWQQTGISTDAINGTVPGAESASVWGSDQFWAEFVQPGRTCKPCVARGMVI
ncbi:hypothetical protein DPL59_01050 [Escherichia coli]|nr:hypothetical protein [Escherichia coli]